MWKSTAAMLCVVVLVPSCSSDDGSDTAGDDAANTDGTSTADAASSSGSTTESGSTDLLPPTESSDSDDASDTNIDATLDGSSSGDSGGESGTIDCPSLNASACARTAECTPIEGSAIVEDADGPDAYCVEPSTPVACRDAAENCNAVLSHACDPAGAVYEIGSDCIPRNWSLCDPPALGAPDC